jgi:hypothetical protein
MGVLKAASWEAATWRRECQGKYFTPAFLQSPFSISGRCQNLWPVLWLIKTKSDLLLSFNHASISWSEWFKGIFLPLNSPFRCFRLLRIRYPENNPESTVSLCLTVEITPGDIQVKKTQANFSRWKVKLIQEPQKVGWFEVHLRCSSRERIICSGYLKWQLVIEMRMAEMDLRGINIEEVSWPAFELTDSVRPSLDWGIHLLLFGAGWLTRLAITNRKQAWGRV